MALGNRPVNLIMLDVPGLLGMGKVLEELKMQGTTVITINKKIEEGESIEKEQSPHEAHTEFARNPQYRAAIAAVLRGDYALR